MKRKEQKTKIYAVVQYDGIWGSYHKAVPVPRGTDTGDVLPDGGFVLWVGPKEKCQVAARRIDATET